MSDTPESVQASVPLYQTKLYALARNTPLLAFMAPELPGQMAAETELDQIEPRLPEQGDATRILINYTNKKGNSLIFTLLDSDRLEHTFTIDNCMEGFTRLQDPKSMPADPVDQTNILILNAISSSLMAVLDLGDDRTTNLTKTVSLLTIRSLVSIVYNDPLDVLIMANEGPSAEDPIKVTAIWPVKSRPYVQESIEEQGSEDPDAAPKDPLVENEE